MWRQGCAVRLGDIKEIAIEPRPPEKAGDDDLLLVVSHDCDLNNADFSKEPYAELFLVSQIGGQASGELLYAKNPRVLQLVTNGKVLEISIHDRYRVDRSQLLSKDPAFLIEPSALTVLTGWLARRYRRPGFPNAFNERIRRVTSRIADDLKKHGANLSGLYLVMSDDELAPEDTYDVFLTGLMPTELYRDGTSRADTQQLIDRIAALFDGCEGLTVRDSELRSEGDVTMDDLRLMQRWDVDSLSFREKPGGPFPPNP
jgi:hypothetical protein